MWAGAALFCAIFSVRFWQSCPAASDSISGAGAHGARFLGAFALGALALGAWTAPAAAETADAPAQAASPPPEHAAALPVRDVELCVEPRAWGDPDIDRNKQVIEDEAICVSTLEFDENGLKWRVQVLDSGRPGNNWIVVHDHEDTAFDAAIYAIAKYGGKIVDVDMVRRLKPHSLVDPNRNFATSDDQRGTCRGPVRAASPIYTATVVKLLGPPPYISLHNNSDGHFLGGGDGNISVRHDGRGFFGLPAHFADHRLADEDNVIIVSGVEPPFEIAERIERVTDELRIEGVNVIYEHVREEAYDCSLSNFLLLHAGAESGQYFNIEAEDGDYRSQIAMIDALVRTVVNPLRASR